MRASRGVRGIASPTRPAKATSPRTTAAMIPPPERMPRLAPAPRARMPERRGDGTGHGRREEPIAQREPCHGEEGCTAPNLEVADHGHEHLRDAAGVARVVDRCLAGLRDAPQRGQVGVPRRRRSGRPAPLGPAGPPTADDSAASSSSSWSRSSSGSPSSFMPSDRSTTALMRVGSYVATSVLVGGLGGAVERGAVQGDEVADLVLELPPERRRSALARRASRMSAPSGRGRS